MLRETKRGMVCLVLLPVAAFAQTFNQVIVFGDSLSDTGNVSNATFGISPGSNYFSGRFSNGILWHEVMAGSLGLSAATPSRTGGRNYAHGGVVTGSGNTSFPPFFSFPNLGTQINQFLGSATPNSNQIFTVWGGGNDFIDDLAQNPTTVVNNLVAHVTALNNAGARYIVVPNLPLLGETPRYNATANRSAYNNLIAGYNAQLAVALTNLDGQIPAKIYQFDVGGTFSQLLANPAQFGLTNVTQPALVNGTVAPNPDSYLFYDDIHPTRVGHRLLAGAAFDLVTTHTWTGGSGAWDSAGQWDVAGTPAANWICDVSNGSGAPQVVSLNPGSGGGAVRRIRLQNAVSATQLRLAEGAELQASESVHVGAGAEISLSPGATLTTGSLTVAGGGLRFALGGASGANGRITVQSAAALSGSLRIASAPGETPLPGMNYTLLTYLSSTGSLSLANETGRAGLLFSPQQAASSLTVSLSGLAGDADLNATVDIDDFSALALNFNLLGGRTWLDGDFTADGGVDIDDFSMLALNFNQSISPSAARGVPEPLGAAFVGFAFAIRRRRRSCGR